jgi:hypothetical protein
VTRSPLTYPMPLLREHTMGLPLEAVWSALECAEQEAARHRDALQAIAGVLDEPCIQRELLRRLAGRFPVAEVKRAIKAGVLTGRLTRTTGARRSHLHGRVSS